MLNRTVIVIARYQESDSFLFSKMNWIKILQYFTKHFSLWDLNTHISIHIHSDFVLINGLHDFNFYWLFDRFFLKPVGHCHHHSDQLNRVFFVSAFRPEQCTTFTKIYQYERRICTIYINKNINSKWLTHNKIYYAVQKYSKLFFS